MFGSKDDNKTAAPEQGAEKAEKRGLFGWLRKKPSEPTPAAQEPQAEVPEALPQASPEPAPQEPSAEAPAAVESAAAVSYTHLTLPTTPYV